MEKETQGQLNMPNLEQKPVANKGKIKSKVKIAKTKKIPTKVKSVSKNDDRPEGLVLSKPKYIDDPSKLTKDRIKLITDTVARGATPDELKLFLLVCRRSQLDPFARQIYLVKRFDSVSGVSRGVIQTGIDGFRTIAERTGEYAGSDDSIFEEPKDAKIKFPVKATVSVYRIVKGQRVAFTASARWSEYYPGEKLGFMWRKMPYAMLGKCAEALALRKGFAQVLGGLYIHEEMAQANRTVISSNPELNGQEAVLTEAPKQANDATYQRAIQWIQKEEDKSIIAEYIDRIKNSGLYNNEQKKQLIAICESKLR